ncbi:MAG TPA: ABC transporter permease [Candidatus Polarisedimenticolia bacterium]|nr:ABC transporter permease [Candidatus Polarisedimenticolia bacterium]
MSAGVAVARRRAGVGPGALWVLAAILVPAMAAPWIAPRPPDLQEDVAGARDLPPLTRAHALIGADGRTRIVTGLRRAGTVWEGFRSGAIARVDEADLASPPAARIFLLGTDRLGRDVLSRVLFGLRHSAGVAALAVALSLLLALLAGSLAVFGGTLADAVIMRGIDVLMAVPRLLVYLLCAALLVPSTPLLVGVFAVTTWTGLARIVRVELMALRGGGLEAAARAAGARPLRTLFRHLLPAILPALAVATALRFADTILLESAVAVLGLGAPPPAVSLGDIMASGRSAAMDWWLVAVPGALLAGLVLALRSAATSLDRLLDPPSIT